MKKLKFENESAHKADNSLKKNKYNKECFHIMTTLFMLLSDFTLCNQSCACVVDYVLPSVHADYAEELTCAMASLDLQDLIHTVLCYRYLPTKQPSPRIWLNLPSLSPLPPSPWLSLNPGPTMGGCFSKPKPGNQDVCLYAFSLSTWLAWFERNPPKKRLVQI